jgi:hypothetical protein
MGRACCAAAAAADADPKRPSFEKLLVSGYSLHTAVVRGVMRHHELQGPSPSLSAAA